MLLYANGCSLTEGMEIGGEIYDSSGIYIGDKNQEYKKNHAWPKVLSTILKMECFNHSKSGSSNDRILRKTLEWTTEYLKTKSSKELFIVIGWSYPSRIEFNLNEKWIGFLPQWPTLYKQYEHVHNFHRDYLQNEIFDSYKTAMNILSLQSWLKINKIPYLFFNALPIIYPKKLSKLHNIIDSFDSKRYYKIEDETFCMHDACEGYPRGPKSHPLEEGHRYWAKMLFKYIRQNNLLEVDG